MENPLDLQVTFTASSSELPLGILATFTLHCDQLQLSHTSEMLRDPLTPKESRELRWYLEEYWKWPYEGFAQRGKDIEALLVHLGQRLYHSLFNHPHAHYILQRWRTSPASWHQISIVSELPQVLSLPWELLHDGQDFLVTHPRHPVSLVRHLPQPEQKLRVISQQLPLRILLVTARPDNAGFIDPRSIARELLFEMQELISIGNIELEFLRPPSIVALRERLRDIERPIHILHFDGHGTFDALTQQSALFFEDEDGLPDKVIAENIVNVLLDGGVQLVLLNACQSAVSAQDAFSSVATTLINGGINAVIAMSASILVSSATSYMKTFYASFAAGNSVPIAHTQAQRFLYKNIQRHLNQRSLTEAGQPVELYDWWVPQYYQQHSFVLQLGEAQSASQRHQPNMPRSYLGASMPAAPRYGFTGRAHELLLLERWLRKKKLVIISGFGGAGKTALVREAADWLTRTSMYKEAYFISFEYGHYTEFLLSNLGTELAIYESSYDPSNSQEALKKLAPILRERPILLIVDNLGSISSPGQVAWPESTQEDFWHVLHSLINLGMGVLLTTRDNTLHPQQYIPEHDLAYLKLGGLRPEDATLLADRLLTKLTIEHKHIRYEELQHLLHELDWLPLALQLVLPIMRDTPISEILQHLEALLLAVVDEQEVGRNRSLDVSLEYSLQQLTLSQQSFLFRLALFVGGAMERIMLIITDIPEIEWIEIRSILERTALLTTERIQENAIFTYLHFHPALGPFLRSHSILDDEQYRQYAWGYFAMTFAFNERVSYQANLVYAIVRKEIPNLWHALQHLDRFNALEAFLDLANSLFWFLDLFGLRYERDRLHQWIERAMNQLPMHHELTSTEYLYIKQLGEKEYLQGDTQIAQAHFAYLHSRMQSLPEGDELGRGSNHHCSIMIWLARCLREESHLAEAENCLYEVSTFCTALMKQSPNDEALSEMYDTILSELGNVFMLQGKYEQAKAIYEKSLKRNEEAGDLHAQASTQDELGKLASMQRNYSQARSHFQAFVKLARLLKEPLMEAQAWSQLGVVAHEQEQWHGAEYYQRRSLTISERLGNIEGMIGSYNNLALLAEESGRPSEAKIWYQRALRLSESTRADHPNHALILNNFAVFLLRKAQKGQPSMANLAEIQEYATKALAIYEKFNRQEETWRPLEVLITLAEMEGQVDLARHYRRRQHEAYAFFLGNRTLVNQYYGRLATEIAAAARGDALARAFVSMTLPRFESSGWQLSMAVQRLWNGERNWHSLVEDLHDNRSALLILLTLESLAPPSQTMDRKPQEVIAMFPASMRESMLSLNPQTIQEAFEALSPIEQQFVVVALPILEALGQKKQKAPPPES